MSPGLAKASQTPNSLQNLAWALTETAGIPSITPQYLMQADNDPEDERLFFVFC